MKKNDHGLMRFGHIRTGCAAEQASKFSFCVTVILSMSQYEGKFPDAVAAYLPT